MKLNHIESCNISEARADFDKEEVYKKLQDVIKKLGFKPILNAENDHFVEAQGKDKYHHFFLWVDSYRGKIEVRYSTPKGMKALDDYFTKPYNNITISLSVTKETDKIVKDIQNRFLDNFEKLAEIYATQDDKNQKYTNGKLDAAKRIYKELGKPVPANLEKDTHRITIYTGLNSLDRIVISSPDSFDVELSLDSVEEVINVIKLLKR